MQHHRVQTNAPSSKDDVTLSTSFYLPIGATCDEILPSALRRYNLVVDPSKYQIYIVVGDVERPMDGKEKPLVIVRAYVRQGLKPNFMLRKTYAA